MIPPPPSRRYLIRLIISECEPRITFADAGFRFRRAWTLLCFFSFKCMQYQIPNRSRSKYLFTDPSVDGISSTFASKLETYVSREVSLALLNSHVRMYGMYWDGQNGRESKDSPKTPDDGFFDGRADVVSQSLRCKFLSYCVDSDSNWRNKHTKLNVWLHLQHHVSELLETPRLRPLSKWG